MSVFVKAVQVIVLVATICGASTFADERSSALSLAVEARSGDTAGAQVAVKNTSDQVAFENKWDDRASPLLAPITASLPSRDQEPTTVDPAPIWSWAATAMLSESSAKWADLQSRILAEKVTLAACRSGDRPCPAAARRFLSIVENGRQRQGRARLGEINRAINLSIRPMSDLAQYGVEDYWAKSLLGLILKLIARLISPKRARPWRCRACSTIDRNRRAAAGQGRSPERHPASVSLSARIRD